MPFRFLSQRQHKISVRDAPVEKHVRWITQAEEAGMVCVVEYGRVWWSIVCVIEYGRVW